MKNNTKIKSKDISIYKIFLLLLFLGNISLKAEEKLSHGIKWEIIPNNKDSEKNKNIKWELIDKFEKYQNHEERYENIKNKKTNNEGGLFNQSEILELGKAIPTSNILEKGELMLETSHVSSFTGGMTSGTGNQNYSGKINYGLFNNLTIGLFYTEADDDLYKKIKLLDTQPENLWSIYGGSIKWKFIKNKKINIALHNSIERWRVGSGGCYGYNCINNSNNIFNSNIQKVVNDNIISSTTLPITLRILNNTEFTFAPKLIILPKKQGNENGDGEFYGNNMGIGLGATTTHFKNARPFISMYIPIGNSLNTFNKNLDFNKTMLYTTGLNYKVDQNTQLEGYITNSFGQTPSTSILTIPSSNELIYGGRLIYRNTKGRKNKIVTSKLSKYTNKTISARSDGIKKGERLFYSGVSSNGTTYAKTELGLSDKFIFEISTEKIRNKTSNEKLVNNFHQEEYNAIRGGGTAILFTNKNKRYKTGIRLTFGRVLAETRPGYLFGEIVNSYKTNKKSILNINPKIAHSGEGSMTSIGTSLNYAVTPKTIILPETNIGIDNSETTYKITLRRKIKSSYIIDSYITNSQGQMDMGKMAKVKNAIVGINLGYKFK